MFYKLIMEKNEDKLFYIDLNDNEKNFSNYLLYNSTLQDYFISVITSNISNNKIYNSIFQNDFIAVIN